MAVPVLPAGVQVGDGVGVDLVSAVQSAEPPALGPGLPLPPLHGELQVLVEGLRGVPAEREEGGGHGDRDQDDLQRLEML